MSEGADQQPNFTEAFAEEVDIGIGVADLLARPGWVNRRVERIRFVDPTTVYRRMSVDFTMRITDTTEPFLRRCPGLIPLATLSKNRVDRFSMWDESGRRLHVLTTEENSYFAAATLVAMAHGIVLRAFNQTLPAELQTVLREIAQRPTEDAQRLVTQLERAASNGLTEQQAQDTSNALDRRFLLDIVGHLPLITELFQGPSGQRPQGPDRNAWIGRRARSRLFVTTVDRLAAQYIVIAQLSDFDEQTLDRTRVLMFEYEAPAQGIPVRETNRQPWWIRWPRNRLRLLREVMGWSPTLKSLGGSVVGSAASYHIEIEAPADIEIVDAHAIAQTDHQAHWEEPHRQLAHLQISGAPRDTTAAVWLHIRSATGGFLSAAVVTSAVITLLLLVGRHQLPHVKHDGSTDPADAVLLALPTLVSAYLLRPGEHYLAARMLLGPRLMLLISAGCSFFAGALLAGQYGIAEQRHDWELAGYIAAAMTAGLIVSLTNAAIRFRYRRLSDYVATQRQSFKQRPVRQRAVEHRKQAVQTVKRKLKKLRRDPSTGL